MKILLKLWTILLFITISTSTSIWAEETIRITNGEWPPSFSKDLKHGGVTSHVVPEAFALEGIKVEYGWFPWKRGLIMAKEGKWDAAIGWRKTL